MRKVFISICCLFVIALTIYGQAKATESQPCRVEYGTPKDGEPTLAEAHDYDPLVSQLIIKIYPYKYIHNGVVPDKFTEKRDKVIITPFHDAVKAEKELLERMRKEIKEGLAEDCKNTHN